jgi:hypothetical protein
MLEGDGRFLPRPPEEQQELGVENHVVQPAQQKADAGDVTQDDEYLMQ